MTSVSLAACQGLAITPHLEALARLRIRIFHDYPYLYDGDLTYETDYLGRYAQNPASLFVLAFDGDELVGASTGQPLRDELQAFRHPFEAAGIDTADVFYYGESVLRASYRGQGIGKAFMAAREEHAGVQGFTTVAFCAVERPDDHPARPADYHPLHGFWQRQGYQRREALVARFGWKDIGHVEETEKPLVFWLKTLVNP